MKRRHSLGRSRQVLPQFAEAPGAVIPGHGSLSYPSTSRRQRLEFLPGCAKGAKLIDRCANRRERERCEWLSQHLVEIVLRSDTNRHMRIEPFASRVCDEVGD